MKFLGVWSLVIRLSKEMFTEKINNDKLTKNNSSNKCYISPSNSTSAHYKRNSYTQN